MKTLEVLYGSTRPDEAWHYEVVAKPVDFETAEAHVELGGALVALKHGSVYAVFDRQFGPTFEGLWLGCTFHLVIRSWQ